MIESASLVSKLTLVANEETSTRPGARTCSRQNDEDMDEFNVILNGEFPSSTSSSSSEDGDSRQNILFSDDFKFNDVDERAIGTLTPYPISMQHDARKDNDIFDRDNFDRVNDARKSSHRQDKNDVEADSPAQRPCTGYRRRAGAAKSGQPIK